MKDMKLDTPPSSLNGEEITGMEDEEFMYLGEVEEIQLDDEEEDDDDDDEVEFMQDVGEEFDYREPPEDHAALVFDKHDGSVFCCDMHPNGKVAVTGGEDDKAFVWSVETGDVIFNCGEHNDSVIFAGFSPDGVYVCTADMSGQITVWKCMFDNNDGAWPVIFRYETDDLTWGRWHFRARVLLFGSVSGDIFIFKIPSGDTKVLTGHNSRVECAKLFHDGVRLAAGYNDGILKIWDMKTSTVLHTLTTSEDQMKVTDIDLHPDDNLMAGLATDGKVMLVTTSNGKIVGELDTKTNLEVVSFSTNPQLGYFALGSLNSPVSIWDSARQMVRHNCETIDEGVYAGVTRMFWLDNLVVTGCLDGSVRVYEGRSGKLLELFTGHRTEVLDMCYSKKGKILLTASDDSSARIYKYILPEENN